MILVTGASGHVGGAALRILAAQRLPAAGLVRSAQSAKVLPSGISPRIADYDDPGSLLRAFEKVSTLIFISSDGAGRNVLRHHGNVLDAAIARRVSSIIFTSIVDIESSSPFYYTPVYRDAEKRLADRAPTATILRCGLYSDFILDHWIKPAISTGTLSLPAGGGKVSPISRNDVAIAAATVAAAPSQHAGNIYELTGQRRLSFHEIVEIGRTALRRPLDFVACSRADYLRRAWAELEDPWPHAFSTLCQSISEGRYECTSDAFERLVGHPAVDFEKFVQNAVINWHSGAADHASAT